MSPTDPSRASRAARLGLSEDSPRALRGLGHLGVPSERHARSALCLRIPRCAGRESLSLILDGREGPADGPTRSALLGTPRLAQASTPRCSRCDACEEPPACVLSGWPPEPRVSPMVPGGDGTRAYREMHPQASSGLSMPTPRCARHGVLGTLPHDDDVLQSSPRAAREEPQRARARSVAAQRLR